MTTPVKPSGSGGGQPAVVVNVPQPATAPAPKATTSRRKPAPWWRRPPTLLCATLTAVLVELVLWVQVGWLWLLVGHLALFALVLAVGTIWKRGDFWRMLTSPFRRTGRDSSATRKTSVSGGSPGRGGFLGRLFPGGRRGAGTGGPGTGRPRRGLLGRSPRGTGTGGPGTGRGTGPRGLLGRLFPGTKGAGRRGPGTGGTGRRGTGTPGTKGTGRKGPGTGGRSPWPFGGRGPGTGRRGRGGTGTPGTGGPGTGGKPGKDKKPGKRGPGFVDTVVDAWKDGWNSGRPGTDQSAEPEIDKPKKDKGPTRPRQPEVPKGEDEMTDQRMHDPDADLFKWGRLLGMTPNQLDEAAQEGGRAVYRANAVAAGLTRMAQQGASELPADKGLAAEVEAIAARARKAAADMEAAQQELRGAQADSESLHDRFRQRHETDLARLEGERAPRHIERRADVGTAEY